MKDPTYIYIIIRDNFGKVSIQNSGRAGCYTSLRMAEYAKKALEIEQREQEIAGGYASMTRWRIEKHMLIHSDL